jgi:hypothetical protein
MRLHGFTTSTNAAGLPLWDRVEAELLRREATERVGPVKP